MMRRLGKGAPRHDLRTLKLVDYIRPSMPAAPPACDWTARVSSWGMYGNDTAGDCTIATSLNMIRCWSANGQLTQIGLPDELALELYSTLSGYNPADPLTDTGLVELDVLKYWKGTGFGGHKINAFLSINQANLDELRLATWLFGGVFAGLELPEAWQDAKGDWGVTSGPRGVPGSWGGHAAPIVAFDAVGPTIITWGAPQRLTWDAWSRYSDEAWVILSSDFFTNDRAPNGFDLVQLERDLAALSSAPFIQA